MESLPNDIQAQSAHLSSIYDLGDCIFHAEHCELHSKVTDQYIHIEKKVAEVFSCLARAEGEIVTREDIFDYVWPGLIVSDDSLNRCISVLRKNLKDFDHNVSIKTHPKIGFNLESPGFNCHHNFIHVRQKTTSTIKDKKQKLIALMIVLSGILISFFLYFILFSSSNTQNIKKNIIGNELINNRIVILPFEFNGDISPSSALIEVEFRRLMVNYPLNNLVVKENDIQLKLDSPVLVGQNYNARFVIKATVFKQAEREIINWQIIDVKTYSEILNRQFNLSLNSSAMNTRTIASDFVYETAAIIFPNEKASQIKYISDYAKYLFMPQNIQANKNPIISLLARTISEIDSNSDTVLLLFAEFIMATIYANDEKNQPFINFAITTLIIY